MNNSYNQLTIPNVKPIEQQTTFRVEKLITNASQMKHNTQLCAWLGLARGLTVNNMRQNFVCASAFLRTCVLPVNVCLRRQYMEKFITAQRGANTN